MHKQIKKKKKTIYIQKTHPTIVKVFLRNFFRLQAIVVTVTYIYIGAENARAEQT